MKDYIVLTNTTSTVSANNEISWNINQSSFKSMKPNDRLILKVKSCSAIMDNGADDGIPGLLLFYCNLNTSNMTTDTGETLLCMENSDVKYLAADVKYYIYTIGIQNEVELYTNPFSKLTVWTTDDLTRTRLEIKHLNLVIEISYYQN